MGHLRAQMISFLLCASIAAVRTHGADKHMDMSMDTSSTHTISNSTPPLAPHRNYNLFDEPNYYSLEAYSGLMMAHIGLMILGWFFILPVGVMFSIARSKLALPVQFLFLLVNGLGVVASTIYNINTPDLYEHNAHHKLGWVVTSVVTAQVVMSLLFLYSGRNKKVTTLSSEQASFIPASLRDMNDRSFQNPRWSGESTQSAQSSFSISSSRTLSPDREYEYSKPNPEDGPDDLEDVPLESAISRPSWIRNTKLDKYLSAHVPLATSNKIVKIAEPAFEVIDRTILILGYATLLSGIVVYTGIFRASNVFNGTAHFVKGSIFFWYGLLTLGRWLGCFADIGWAWNLKPTRSEVGWKTRVPTAEFVESFVIFVYGCTNVFMEHMAAWGEKWTAQDFEHVSISIMFFGGGLAGMLVESKTLRTWMNTQIDSISARTEVHAEEAERIREHPRLYVSSLNIMPALIILLLGIMMSSHHQDSMVSTMVHKQWGTLLSGFSLCRGFTYLLIYLSPPKSVYPSRPPTELAASFCLISGGLIFMLSTRDIIHYMEVYNLMAMFVFTVVMGFTAFLMAFTMFVVGLKGWVVRRERAATRGRF